MLKEMTDTDTIEILKPTQQIKKWAQEQTYDFILYTSEGILNYFEKAGLEYYNKRDKLIRPGETIGFRIDKENLATELFSGVFRHSVKEMIEKIEEEYYYED